MNPNPPPAEGPLARVTPMMAQYIEIKAANPDCLLFYRMGDFYELFFEDAEVASRALGIVLTKRGKHEGADIPMCGVPIERADDYLQRLIGLGHRVAVCEQIEDPAQARKRGPKSVVRRDVVRLVTPGTITEERLLDPGRANLLVAVTRLRAGETRTVYGVAAVDISTGGFTLRETGEAELAGELARLEPSEIVVTDGAETDAALARALETARAPVTRLGREAASAAQAERTLAEFYRVATLEGFGRFSRAELAAAALAVAYVARTQKGARPALAPPTREESAAAMEIDPATRANLELTRTLSGERAGSLLATIDRTVTPAGGRLLAERLASPLTDPDAIARRHEAIAFLIEEGAAREALRKLLAGAPDMARALSRLALERGGPRDLAALRDGLKAADAAARIFEDRAPPPEIAEAAVAARREDAILETALAAALADDLPLARRDGGFVRGGFDPLLDETRALRDESRRVVAELQARYAEETGARPLRVKHNNFLGYFIEVNQAQGEALLKPPFAGRFHHRQTMAGAMRFSTNELGELEAKIASAADRALAMELDIFQRLAGMALAQAEAIKRAADGLAALDVASALADLAARRDWTRPRVDRSLAFRLEGARHPVVEAALQARGEPFVANDCDLEGDASGGAIAIVTGPNMAGKSTYLRQSALIAILAQAGSYVPARRAHLGVVDRLFSRVGAADDLARGRSTFMVEMVETAAILNRATDRSLVALDEIGRGTATFDGLSIAWAAIEHLNATNRSRALFATHFHELTQLSTTLERVKNLTMRVTDHKGEVIFLHEMAAGAADRSYGIQVARLAGLPASVVERARALLAALEASDRRRGAKATLADLPLFAAAAAAPASAPPPVEIDALREALALLDPDDLTPRGALEALYRLKRLAAPR
ncbi:MAG: DNA mismatch repair protein MutS [Methylobacteriaceae bacterium]|nr:DNA mismatch repair protein MutS [Methylobacteriaceae bacterium]